MSEGYPRRRFYGTRRDGTREDFFVWTRSIQSGVERAREDLKRFGREAEFDIIDWEVV